MSVKQNCLPKNINIFLKFNIRGKNNSRFNFSNIESVLQAHFVYISWRNTRNCKAFAKEKNDKEEKGRTKTRRIKRRKKKKKKERKIKRWKKKVIKIWTHASRLLNNTVSQNKSDYKYFIYIYIHIYIYIYY